MHQMAMTPLPTQSCISASASLLTFRCSPCQRGAQCSTARRPGRPPGHNGSQVQLAPKKNHRFLLGALLTRFAKNLMGQCSSRLYVNADAMDTATCTCIHAVSLPLQMPA
jgi:hypothetical protein